MPALEHQDVDTAVREHRAAQHVGDGVLARDVDVHRERPARAPGGDDLLGHGGGALDVQVGHGHVRPELRQAARRRAADAAAAAGDHGDPPRELAPRRRLRELVPLERPVLDGERLGLAERAVAARGVRGVLDDDGAVVEVAGQPGAAGVAAGRDDAEPGQEHDARPRGIDGIRPALVGEVGGVVGAIPVARTPPRPRSAPRADRPPSPRPGRTRPPAAGASCGSGGRGTARRPGSSRASPARSRRRRPRGCGRPPAPRRRRPRAGRRAATAARRRAARRRGIRTRPGLAGHRVRAAPRQPAPARRRRVRPSRWCCGRRRRSWHPR